MRVRKSITLPKDLVDWLNKKIEERRFYNLSHAVEEALRLLKKREEELRE